MAAADRRRTLIRELLAQREVGSQSELLELLRARGFDTSQPVLSRDLRALGVAKRGGVYQILEEERVTPLSALASLLRDTAPAESFVLVRCEPGAAAAIGRALEAESPPGVLGTVAGDDTLLVAVTTRAAGSRLSRRLHELL